jgi:hypothetical protein
VNKQVVKLKSGLDGYLHLQAIDDNECLKRAMGKVKDEKTGVIYHLDYDPPPTMKANPKEKYAPSHSYNLLLRQDWPG